MILKKPRPFYERGLGFTISAASGNDVAFFQFGAMGLALYPRHLLAEDATVSDEGSGFSGITLAQITGVLFCSG